MNRVIALNSSVRKRMPPKRSGAPLFDERPRKIRKVIFKYPGNGAIVTGVKKPNNMNSLLHKLKRVLEKNNTKLQIPSELPLCLQKIASTPYLPPKLTIRLLELCVHIGNQNIVHELLTNQTIDLKTFDGGKMLLQAIAADREAIAAMLMRHGADLSDRRASDDSTLLHAVTRSYKVKSDAEREELVRLLLRCGADVDARDKAGYSVLHDAVVYEHCSARLVEELLDYGARLTIDMGCTDLNDIFAATCYKPALLPRIIEHQVPDEESRNLRAVMAMDYLISRQNTEAKAADTKRMIERILDLGVPVNTVDPLAEQRIGKRECPLLSTALFHKKKKVIKLLVKRGADPHKKDELGRTPLFHATAFKRHSWALRWLIKKGANIHIPNDDGRYPIHGACSSESLRNIHLLLNLGADLKVTDDQGYPPFSYTRGISNYNEAQFLLIKHLALIVAKGEQINDDDLAKINRYKWSRLHFKKCLKQLQRMKEKKVWKDVSYFSLLTNICSVMKLMKNRKFVKSFKGNDQKRSALFSNYSCMLLHCFEVGKKTIKMFRAKKKELQAVFGDGLPDYVIEKITYFLCLENLERCQYDYYMSLHASSKHNKADKVKML